MSLYSIHTIKNDISINVLSNVSIDEVYSKAIRSEMLTEGWVSMLKTAALDKMKSLKPEQFFCIAHEIEPSETHEQILIVKQH
jgi:hypothetical protein